MKPEVILLNENISEKGILTFVENSSQLPITIHRVFWITSVPEGETRGLHAHREETQILLCLKGNITVVMEDLMGEIHKFEIRAQNQALILPALYWSEVTFSEEAILLGLSDKVFSEKDYIRDKTEFENLQRSHRR